MQAITKDDKTWAMLAHLSALVGYLVLPLGNILGPLVIWLVKKDQSWFVDDQGKEALNFQISITIYFLVSLMLVFVLIGIVLIGILYVFGIVVAIIATIRANSGVPYRYPLTIRFIR